MSLLVFSLPLNHLFCLKFLFIPRNSGPSMAQKIKTFSAPVLERETLLRLGEGSFVVTYPRLSKYGIQVRCNVGLHAAAKRYATAWSASLLCTRGSTAALLCCFFCFGSFLYCLVSFLVPILPCSIKHYSIED